VTAETDDLPNLGKLIKLLKMTTSSNDNEALMFVRKANEELKKFGGDWETLLRGKVTVIGDPFDGVSAPPVDMQKSARASKSSAYHPQHNPPPPPQPFPPRTSPRGRPQPSTGSYTPSTPPQAAKPAAPVNPNPFNASRSSSPPRKNLYASKCRSCGTRVDVNQGILIDTAIGWKVECLACTTGTTPQSQKAPKFGQKRGTISVENLADLLGGNP
jgi:hypothetical protein